MKNLIVQICMLLWIVILFLTSQKTIITRLDTIKEQLTTIEQEVNNKNQEISSNREIIKSIIKKIDYDYKGGK